MSKMIYACTIAGRPIVKKNSQRVFGRGRSKRVVYSPKFVEWNNMACASVLATLKPKQAPISCSLLGVFRFYFKNQSAEADVSNLIEGPQDVLKKCGVIVDDRLFRRVIAEKFFGHEPRVEIEIYEYECKGAA